MSTLEAPPTPSPRSKLGSKLRRNRKEPDPALSTQSLSTQSLVSSSTDGDDTTGSRNLSVDGAIDKFKARARKSVENSRTSGDGGNRLSRLLPEKMKIRRGSSVDVSRRSSRSLSDDGIPVNGNLSASQSQLSLNGDTSGNSSLLTEDSDNETKPTRPKFSPHQSHAGYLTLSSPLIKSESRSSVDTSLNGPPSVEVQEHSASSPQLSGPVKKASPPALPARRSSPEQKYKEPATLAGSEKSEDTAAVRSEGAGGEGTGGLSSKSKTSLNSRQNDQDTSPGPQLHDREEIVALEPPKTPSSARKRAPSIDTSARPQTPPNTVNTPSTLVTPPTPTIAQQESPTKAARSSATLKTTLTPTNASSAPTSGVRVRPKSGSIGASKLSNAISASPLTPTVEEAKTPGGTLTTPSGPGGFFSSVFSAAQNAADQFSKSINTSIVQNQKGKTSSHASSFGEAGGEEVIPGPADLSVSEPTVTTTRQPAVETLGQGELNLSHLGISTSGEDSLMHSTIDVSNSPTAVKADDVVQKSEESAAARAVSAAYDKPIQSMIAQSRGRPLSVGSNSSVDGEQSPSRAPPPQVGDGTDFYRSSSIRSRLSDRRKRRHRGSSVTTGGSTLTTTVDRTTTNGTVHKLTGFAVASSNRNKDFHQLFRSVPEDDYLIEDYSAALQRDILLHGRLYVSEAHICFSSNILGWVTNLVMSFDEIVSMEKKNTAVIFPNAIAIQTLHARNVFASLVARESTYELLIGIWKINHPNLKSSLNGVALDDADIGDKTEKVELAGSEEGSEDGSEDVYDEDAEDDGDMGSFTSIGRNGSIAGSDIAEGRTLSRKPSANMLGGPLQTNGSIPKGLENADTAVAGAAVGADFPGPPIHGPTECGDREVHYDKELTDVIIPAQLGKVYNIMFGPASAVFMKKFLIDDEKSKEVVYEDDKTGLDDSHKTFQYSYIKPLNAPVGPRQTKCIVTSTLDALDLERAVCVNQSTVTPYVPSGSIFTTKTRYCLMWGPDNSTRLIANYTIEWTGKSWLRGPIEKGAGDGQMSYVKDIVAAVRAAVTTKPPVKGQTRTKGKGRKRKETFDTVGTEAERAVEAKKEEEANWGLLEPLRGILGPVVSPFQPFFTPQIIIAILLIFLAQAWFFGPKKTGSLGFPTSHPERFAAYEQIWRREESDLWEWLEDRVGLDNINQVPLGQSDTDAKARQKVMRANSMGKKIGEASMDDRQVDDAIRVTEERLLALKQAMEKKKALKSGA